MTITMTTTTDRIRIRTSMAVFVYPTIAIANIKCTIQTESINVTKMHDTKTVEYGGKFHYKC